MVLENFPEQFQRGSLVSALLDQRVENFAFLVDGPPQEHPLAVDPDDHLVQVPYIISAPTSAPNVSGDDWPKLVGPASDGVICNVGRKLTEAKQREIWNCTRTPHKVTWPEWWKVRA